MHESFFFDFIFMHENFIFFPENDISVHENENFPTKTSRDDSFDSEMFMGNWAVHEIFIP